MTKVRRAFCPLAVREMGYAGAGVARVFGVTTSAANRACLVEPDFRSQR